MSTVRELFKSASATPSEKRSELRFPLRLPVTMLSSPRRETYLTRDIGFRGVFIMAERCPSLRNLVRFGMILPVTGAELVLHAMVVRVILPDDPGGHEPGMGLELYAADRSTRMIWSALVGYARDLANELEGQSSAIRTLAGDPERRR
jgi:hypothetical protein